MGSECLSQKSGRYLFVHDSSIHQHGSGAWCCQSCCKRKMGSNGLIRKYTWLPDGRQFSITKETLYYSMDDIMAIEKDPTRWVQVPPDCLKWSPLKLDKLVTDMDKEGVLEFGVQFYNPFIAVSPKEDDQKWRRELKVGDIVDAKCRSYVRWNNLSCAGDCCRHCQCIWYEAVIRYIRNDDECPNGGRLLSLHFIGLDAYGHFIDDDIVSAMDTVRIKKRGTIVGPHQMMYWCEQCRHEEEYMPCGENCELCRREDAEKRRRRDLCESEWYAHQERVVYELHDTPDVKAAVNKCIESMTSSGKEKYKRRMKARRKMLKRKEMKRNRRKRDCRRSLSKRGNRMGGRSTNRNNGKFGMDLSPDFVLC